MITVASRPNSTLQKLLAAADTNLDPDHDTLGHDYTLRKASEIPDSNVNNQSGSVVCEAHNVASPKTVPSKPVTNKQSKRTDHPLAASQSKQPKGPSLLKATVADQSNAASTSTGTLDVHCQSLHPVGQRTAKMYEGRPRNTKHGLRSAESVERRGVQLMVKKRLSRGTAEDIRRLAAKPAIAEAAHFILVKAFLKMWALSTDSAVDFMQCSVDQRTQIMSTFKRKGSRNIDEAFNFIIQKVQQKDAVGSSIDGVIHPCKKNRLKETCEQKGHEEESRCEAQREVHNAWNEAPKTPSDDDEMLDQFIEKWQLDGASVQMLQKLSQEDRQVVVEKFAPHGDSSWNVSFVSFVKTKLHKNVAYEEIAAEWGLSMEAKAFLYSLPKPVADQALADFSPSPAQDASASFLNLCKRRLLKSQNVKDPIIEFAAKFSLSDEAASYLRSLVPCVRAAVLTNFNPPAKVGVSSQLIHFAQSRERSAMKESDPVLQFAASWRLNHESVALLRECPVATQCYVMEKFSPPPECNGRADVNERFKKYLKLSSVPLCSDIASNDQCSIGASCDPLHSEDDLGAKSKEYSGSPTAVGVLCNSFVDGNVRNDDDLKSHSHRSPAPCKYFQNGYCRNGTSCKFLHTIDVLSAFQQKWGLDDDAVGQLTCCPLAIREDVMANFSPKCGWQDKYKTNAKFISFLHSRANAGNARYHEEHAQTWKRQRTF